MYALQCVHMAQTMQHYELMQSRTISTAHPFHSCVDIDPYCQLAKPYILLSTKSHYELHACGTTLHTKGIHRNY